MVSGIINCTYNSNFFLTRQNYFGKVITSIKNTKQFKNESTIDSQANLI